MKIKAFSLTEMLIALLVISVILSAMVPALTKKPKKPPEIKIERKSDVPIGAIIFWYGPNIPAGWMECSGQDISDKPALSNALGGISALPNLNAVSARDMKWIIKFRS